MRHLIPVVLLLCCTFMVKGQSFLAELDPVSYDLSNIDDPTNYVGVGMVIQKVPMQGWFKVNLVTKDGPASNAGLLPGDYITRVDGKPVTEMDMDSITKFLRVKEGKEITLGLMRNYQYFDISVVPRKLL